MKLAQCVWFILILTAGLGCGSGTDSKHPPLTPQDTAPPLSPEGLNVPKVDAQGFLLTWEENWEPDLNGYRVYLAQPGFDQGSTYVLQNSEELLDSPRFVYWAGEMPGEFWARVSAVDQSGNESPLSSPLHITWDAGRTQETMPDLAGGHASDF